jgi:hypothetical protein
VPQSEIEIGVPELREIDELRLRELVRMPFDRRRSARLSAGQRVSSTRSTMRW